MISKWRLVSAFANVVSPGALEITQLADKIKIRLISQLIKDIQRVPQKLLFFNYSPKIFWWKSVSTLALSALLILSASLDLTLNNFNLLKYFVVYHCHIVINFLMLLNNSPVFQQVILWYCYIKIFQIIYFCTVPFFKKISKWYTIFWFYLLSISIWYCYCICWIFLGFP